MKAALGKALVCAGCSVQQACLRRKHTLTAVSVRNLKAALVLLSLQCARCLQHKQDAAEPCAAADINHPGNDPRDCLDSSQTRRSVTRAKHDQRHAAGALLCERHKHDVLVRTWPQHTGILQQDPASILLCSGHTLWARAHTVCMRI